MSEPKYKLGDDGELEEVIDDLNEKPKRKRKPYNRTLYIPLSLMLALIIGVALLGFIAVYFTRPTQPQFSENIDPTYYFHPTETPGGLMDKIPPCAMFPVEQKPRLVYSINPGNSEQELLRINADGTNNCILTKNNVYDGEPSWSPDGTRIVYNSMFSSASYGFENQLYIMNANGENIIKLTSDFSNVAAPDWSPDGKRIVFQGIQGKDYYQLFVINVDGTNVINLTNVPRNDTHAKWSPDGQSIVFISGPLYQSGLSSDIDQSVNDEIFVMDANGGNLRQITTNKVQEDFPSWSPDGQWLAFVRDDDIYVMDKNGQHARRVARGYLNSSAPVWTPDGNEVGFVAFDPDAIRFVNIHSGQTRLILVPDTPINLAGWWPPTSSP